MRLRISNNQRTCEILDVPGLELPQGNWLRYQGRDVGVYGNTPSAPIDRISWGGIGQTSAHLDIHEDGIYELRDSQITGPLDEDNSEMARCGFCNPTLGEEPFRVTKHP